MNLEGFEGSGPGLKEQTGSVRTVFTIKWSSLAQNFSSTQYSWKLSALTFGSSKCVIGLHLSRQFGETLVMKQNLLGVCAKFRKANVSLVVSVLPFPLDGFSWGFNIWLFFEKKMPRKFKFDYNLTGITCFIHDDRYTFLVISRWIFLRKRNVSENSCKRKSELTFYVKKVPPPPDPRKSCRLWANVGKYVRAREHYGIHVNQNMQLLMQWHVVETDKPPCLVIVVYCLISRHIPFLKEEAAFYSETLASVRNVAWVTGCRPQCRPSILFYLL